MVQADYYMLSAELLKLLANRLIVTPLPNENSGNEAADRDEDHGAGRNDLHLFQEQPIRHVIHDSEDPGTTENSHFTIHNAELITRF